MSMDMLRHRARAFDYLFDAVVVTNMEGIVTDWNLGAERLYGWARAEILGRPVSVLHDAADVGRVTAEVFAGIERQGFWTGELKRVAKDGSVGWIDSFVIPIADDAGVPLGALGINRDISERKRAEQALRDSEAKWRTLIESSPDGIVIVDTAGRIVTVNEQTERIFGYTRAELVGAAVESLIPPAQRERHPAHRAAYARAPARRQMNGTDELVGLRKDGREVLLEIGLSHVATADGTRIMAVVRDVTERAAMVAQLKLQSTALEAAASGIAITDVRGICLWVNPGFTATTGYAAAEIVGRSLAELGTGSADAAFFERLFERVRGGRSWSGELEARHRDGHVYAEEMSVSAVRDARGETVSLVAIKQDVTDRRRIAHALHEAKEAAESATRAKSEFLANTSHELRTPLHAMIGLSELLRETELSPRQRSMLETIGESGESLLALINDLLDLSRLEAERLELDERAVELEPLFARTMAQLAPQAAEKRVELFWTIDPEVPAELRLDGRRLAQIVLNIAGNAVKFTEHGQVAMRVGLSATRAPAAGGAVRLRVAIEDTGPGIRPDQQHRLFRSFSQIDGSSTRRFGGSGLGLAIAKALVERMGGRIEVESEGVTGRGARFQFEVDALASGPPVAAVAVEPRLRGRRAGVVSAHEGLRASLRHQLEAMGLATVEVAPDALAASTCDVLVVDEPFASASVAAQLGAALVLLGSVGAEQRPLDPRGRAAPLAKPVRPRALRDVLLRVLGSRSRIAAVASPPESFATLSPMHVLLAEDSPVNQRVVTAQLARLGVTCEVVGDGPAALEAIRTRSFDASLLDVNMPGLDGCEVARAVRALDTAAARLPLIAMTASAMPGDRERCLSAGMDDYLSKPVRLAALERALRRVHATASTEAPREPPATQGEAFDPSALLELQRELGDRAAVDEVCATFARAVGALLDAAEHEQRVGDLRAVRRAAHNIKGSAASCGAPELERLGAQMEQRIDADERVDVATWIATVRAALGRFLEALAGWRA